MTLRTSLEGGSAAQSGLKHGRQAEILCSAPRRGEPHIWLGFSSLYSSVQSPVGNSTGRRV